ncbi:MAG: hypothetical protein QM820_62665 [Minicystis sp.]
MVFADTKNEFVFRRIVATQPQSQWAREYGEAKEAEGFAEGFARGLARAILALLAARGLSVSPEARARIEACKDAATLERWIAGAATAASVEAILGEAAARS